MLSKRFGGNPLIENMPQYQDHVNELSCRIIGGKSAHLKLNECSYWFLSKTFYPQPDQDVHGCTTSRGHKPAPRWR